MGGSDGRLCSAERALMMGAALGGTHADEGECFAGTGTEDGEAALCRTGTGDWWVMGAAKTGRC